MSVCELTDTYSHAAIESAQATSPASVARIIGSRISLAAATQIARLAVESIQSLAHNTAARNQFVRFM
jgi:hypothetical protein